MRVSTPQVISEQHEAYRLYQQGLSRVEIAEQMGIHYESVKRRIQGARKRLALDPELAAKLEARGIVDLAGLHSGWLIDRDENGGGQSLYFYLGPDGPVPLEEHCEIMAEAFKAIPPVTPVEPPENVEKGKVAFFPVADWHLGAVTTESETGAAYNREVAVTRLKDGFMRCQGAIPPCETAIILCLGDLTHANDYKDRTPRSGNVLKVEGTHHANLTLACQTVCWAIDAALMRHGNVIVSVRRGNHDPSTPIALILAIKARYADEPRVSVQDDESDFFLFQKDKLFIAAHHGDGQKPEKMAMAIPHRFRREWGRSDHHYLFTGHLHHTKGDTFGGLYWKQLPALCRVDQHAHQMGYADTGGMMAMHFDTKGGACAEYTVRL